MFIVKDIKTGETVGEFETSEEAERFVLVEDDQDHDLEIEEAREDVDPYVHAIQVLTDNDLGQDLTTVLIACACRNAIDPYEEEEEIMRTPFDVFCNVVSNLWVDCEDRISVCVIADWLVQWIISHPEDYPTSYSALREWAESEGI